MQIFVRCTVVVRYFHQKPIFVYRTVQCKNRMTYRLKIMFSDRYTLLRLKCLTNTQFEMLAVRSEEFCWSNENLTRLNRYGIASYCRIKLKFVPYVHLTLT